jgi:hypothetical protein
MITVHVFGNAPPPVRHVTRDLRALWALEESGLPYRLHPPDFASGELKRPEYTRTVPWAQIVGAPYLVLRRRILPTGIRFTTANHATSTSGGARRPGRRPPGCRAGEPDSSSACELPKWRHSCQPLGSVLPDPTG